MLLNYLYLCHIVDPNVYFSEKRAHILKDLDSSLSFQKIGLRHLVQLQFGIHFLETGLCHRPAVKFLFLFHLMLFL